LLNKELRIKVTLELRHFETVMLEQDWLTYLASEEPGYFQICLLDPELAAHLRARTLAVHVDRAYIDKLFQKHNIAREDLPLIQMTIQQGVAIQDDDRHITFFLPQPRESAFQGFNQGDSLSRGGPPLHLS